MGISREIILLVKKELSLEFRQKHAISGILLYVLTTVFIVYVSFVQIQPQVWNTVYWIIILFAAVNALLKSFSRENTQRGIYYYTLTSPYSVLISKILYNFLLLFVLSVISYIGLSFVSGNPVRHFPDFVMINLMAGLGFSVIFTFISAISNKSDQSATLMTILGFPLTIPVILILIKLSAQALGLLTDTSSYQDVLILLAIDLLLFSLSVFLFPYLWRE